MAIHAYRMDADTPEELSKRLDGIVAGLRHGDVVIFKRRLGIQRLLTKR